MSIPVDDTLTPRNGADFPIVDGPLKPRAYSTFSALPAANTFPDGTLVAVIDQGYKLYVNSAGNWLNTEGGGSAGSIQQNGVNLPARINLNFVSSSRLTAVDAGSGPNAINIDLAATGISANSYTLPNVTVDIYGRVTGISNGTAYTTVDLNGSALTQRSTLNFSNNFSALDNGGAGRTDVDLATTTVTPGSYTLSSIIVDAFGRITAASNGTAYTTIDINGSPLVHRPTLNFSNNFNVIDNGGASRTDVDLATTAVTPGSYTFSSLTVDAFGRITAASSGSPLPSQGGHGGQFLKTDGTNPSWNAIQESDVTNLVADLAARATSLPTAYSLGSASLIGQIITLDNTRKGVNIDINGLTGSPISGNDLSKSALWVGDRTILDAQGGPTQYFSIGFDGFIYGNRLSASEQTFFFRPAVTTNISIPQSVSGAGGSFILRAGQGATGSNGGVVQLFGGAPGTGGTSGGIVIDAGAGAGGSGVGPFNDGFADVAIAASNGLSILMGHGDGSGNIVTTQTRTIAKSQVHYIDDSIGNFVVGNVDISKVYFAVADPTISSLAIRSYHNGMLLQTLSDGITPSGMTLQSAGAMVARSASTLQLYQNSILTVDMGTSWPFEIKGDVNGFNVGPLVISALTGTTGITLNSSAVVGGEVWRINSTNQHRLEIASGASYTVQLYIDTGGDLERGIYPGGDQAVYNGHPAIRWLETFSMAYSGAVQTPTNSGAVSLSAASLGQTIVFTANGNVTSLSLAVGHPDQHCNLILVQDGAGTSSWPTTITNVKLPGGTFTKSTGANAVDRLDLVCDGTVWYALALGTNLS